jgi:hypothetical protein
LEIHTLYKTLTSELLLVTVQDSLSFFSDYIYNNKRHNFPEYEIYYCVYGRKWVHVNDEKVDQKLHNDYDDEILDLE